MLISKKFYNLLCSVKAILLLISVPLFSAAQTEVYNSRNFQELAGTHKTIAIILFNTTLELDENIDAKRLVNLQKQEAYSAQEALETYFLKRKRRKKISVEIQDIQHTNAVLKKNGIDINNIDIYSPKELSKLLEVDGIVSGVLRLHTLISEGVDESFNIISVFKGKTDFGTISIKISDGTSGKMLWKYSKTLNRKTGRNTYAIIERMLRKAARKLPYESISN